MRTLLLVGIAVFALDVGFASRAEARCWGCGGRYPSNHGYAYSAGRGYSSRSYSYTAGYGYRSTYGYRGVRRFHSHHTTLRPYGFYSARSRPWSGHYGRSYRRACWPR